MTGDKSEGTVNPDESDLGDVLGIVEAPSSHRVPERFWTIERVARPVAYAAVGAVTLAVLEVAKGNQPTSRRSPHVALMALADARRLASQELLFFPNGGPAVGQTYGRHPLRRRAYLPYASFHQLVLHEKSIEIARYLLALGARDVEITCHQANGNQAKGEAGIPIPSVDDISLTMGFGRDATGRLSIRIGGAGKRGSVPADLIWPSQDPVFKLVREAARAGAGTFRFGLTAEQSGSVNAHAAVKIKSELGLDLGGEYKRWEDLSFTVNATFGEGSARS